MKLSLVAIVVFALVYAASPLQKWVDRCRNTPEGFFLEPLEFLGFDLDYLGFDCLEALRRGQQP
jgi:hypothetical protein